MAAAAPKGESHEVLLSTPEKENFQRIARLLVAGGTAIMRELFDQFCNPSQLVVKLKNPSIKKNIMKAKLTKPQLDYLFPKTGTRNKSSKDFDISLIFKLFRTICNLTPPARGWDNFPPPPTDDSLAADLLRIKGYRNKICHDYSDMEMGDTEFKSLWNDIQEALVRLAGNISLSAQSAWEKEIEKLLTDPLTPEEGNNAKELMEMCENEVECKEEIKKVGKSLQERFDGVHQAMERTGDDIRHAIKRTGDDVHQAIKRTGDDMQQAIEKVFKKVTEKKNDSETSPLLTESALVAGAQDSDFLGEERASAPWDASAVPADQLPHLSSVGKLTPPGKVFTETLSQRSPQLPAGDTVEDFEKLFEIAAAVEMEKGHLGVKEMKEKLYEFIIERRQEERKAFSVLTEAKNEDAKKKKDLMDFYSQGEKCFCHLDEKLEALVQKNMGDVREKIRRYQNALGEREYFLLVAGETGAGKSSLVNLILRDELLPYSLLSTTSTICEMRYGKERKIVVHFKDKDPETGSPTIIIPLVEPQEGATTQSYLQQISPYVHLKVDRDKGSLYKKVELYWPHELLESGVVIIDSPGVGESEIMDETVTEYLPQAFAFIYVVNCVNSGGLQKDRLVKLLEAVVRKRKQGQEEFPARCALFVCNKWDQVPKKEIEEVKRHVVTELTKCWPGLDPRSQIFYMSIKNASISQSFGVITRDFDSFMTGMRSMVLKGIEARLELHWRWLDELLSRIIYHATAFVDNASKDQVKVAQRMAEIRDRLMRLKTEQSQAMEGLRTHLEDGIDKALDELDYYLQSDEFKSRFTSWTLDEVPRAESSWEATVTNIRQALQIRLGNTLRHWEEDKHVFADARKSLLQDFQKKYNFFEDELRNLQSAVTSDEVVEKIYIPEKESLFTLRGKIAIGVTSPLWVPFGLIALLIGAPVAGIVAIRRKWEDKRRIRDYDKEKCAFMAKMSAEFLDDVLSTENEDALKNFVVSHLKDAELCLEQIEARIPQLIQADLLLCEKLSDETRSKEVIVDLYRPRLDEAMKIRGDLSAFLARDVRRLGVNSLDLDGEEDKLLG